MNCNYKTDNVFVIEHFTKQMFDSIISRNCAFCRKVMTVFIYCSVDLNALMKFYQPCAVDGYMSTCLQGF